MAPEERNAKAAEGLLDVETQKLLLLDEKRDGERPQSPKANDNSGYFGFRRDAVLYEVRDGSIVPAS